MEGSPCGVPSNKAALCLYDKNTGEIISEERIKLSITKLTASELKPLNNSTMEKILLSSNAQAALLNHGVSKADEVLAISNAIVDLDAKLTSEKALTAKLQAKLDDQLKLSAESLVNPYVADGTLTAEEGKEFTKDALENYALTAKLLSKMPRKTNLSAKVKLKVDGEENEEASPVKTKEEFFKLSSQAQLDFKNNFPNEYSLLWAKKKR